VLATLPERCRTIFTWKRIEGMSQREIAQRLGVSENVVENDIQKALRAIQRMLRDVEELVQDKIIDDRRHG
jgi:RNA polymerase sigma factor (sigma-70 family)